MLYQKPDFGQTRNNEEVEVPGLCHLEVERKHYLFSSVARLFALSKTTLLQLPEVI